MNNKNMGIALFLTAGLIIAGLLNRWDFNTWRVIDVLVVLVIVIIGFVLIKRETINTKKFKIITIVLTVLIIVSVLAIFGYNKIQKEKLKCKFSLTNMVENRYQEDKAAYSEPCFSLLSGYNSIFCKNGYRNYDARHYTYWEIDGMLKNNSYKNQYLGSIILKIYTNDERKILLTEGFIDVKKNLTSGQSYPFQVRAQINRDSDMSKYFNKNDNVEIDIYPYFLSCSY